MNWKLFIKSTLFFIFTSIVAAVMHYLAKTENMIEYTLLGFLAGVSGALYYGTNMGWDLANARCNKRVDMALGRCSKMCSGTSLEKNPDFHEPQCLSEERYCICAR